VLLLLSRQKEETKKKGEKNKLRARSDERSRALFRSEMGDFVTITGVQHLHF
jgi:hypothetical protein